MAQLRIPPAEQDALAKLQSLSDETASKLLAAIESAARKAETDGLRITDLGDVPGVSTDDLERILKTVISLCDVRAFSDVNLDEFIGDISESLSADRRKDFLEDGSTKRFQERLRGFLGIHDLNLVEKSRILRYEQERTVDNVRILTDVRPVFGDGIAELPEAVVIVHNLKIKYHHAETGRLQELFFGLDDKDLGELKAAIQRAESKAASLRSALAKAKIRVFNLR